MKISFSDTLNASLQGKANTSEILTKQKYIALIEDVKQAKAKEKKESVDYRRLKNMMILKLAMKKDLLC